VFEFAFLIFTTIQFTANGVSVCVATVQYYHGPS
jgi:hypothetical protein